MQVRDKNGVLYLVESLTVVREDGQVFLLQVPPTYRPEVVLGNAFELTQLHPLPGT